MQRLARILNELPEEGRLRAVRYLIDRFGPKPAIFIDPKSHSAEVLHGFEDARR